jgi:group I intron endonuclease
MGKKKCIYLLEDPISGNPMYVGQTFDIKKRMARHMEKYELNRSKMNVSKWIKSLKEIGKKPSVFILEESVDNGNFWETYYFFLYRSFGFNLLNTTMGGQSPSKTKEVKDKISKAKTGLLFSMSHKNNLSKAAILRGAIPPIFNRKRTDEEKSKISKTIIKRNTAKYTYIAYNFDGELVGTFLSWLEIRIFLNNKKNIHSNIIASCNGKKNAYGFNWERIKK